MAPTKTDEKPKTGEQPTGEKPTGQPTGQPTGEQPTGQADGEQPKTGEQPTGEQPTPARTRTKAPDLTNISIDGINSAKLASVDLIEAAAPVRERKEAQLAMDKVAVRAYEAWVKAGRPAAWNKTPVITYYLTEDEVPAYRYLIRHAAEIVEPVQPTGADAKKVPGVRARFGNTFTLSEAMAAKFKMPENAGKTVLAWAAIDKRNLTAEEAAKAAAATAEQKEGEAAGQNK